MHAHKIIYPYWVTACRSLEVVRIKGRGSGRPVAKGGHFGAVPPRWSGVPPRWMFTIECPPRSIAAVECPPAPRWMPSAECECPLAPAITTPRIPKTSPTTPPRTPKTSPTTPPRTPKTSPTTPPRIRKLRRLPPPLEFLKLRRLPPPLEFGAPLLVTGAPPLFWGWLRAWAVARRLWQSVKQDLDLLGLKLEWALDRVMEELDIRQTSSLAVEWKNWPFFFKINGNDD